MKNLERFHRRLRRIYIPFLILLTLFVLTYFSEASHIYGFESYNFIPERNTLSNVPNSSDIDIVLKILNLNVSSQEIEYSFYIHAWLDINMTDIEFLLQTYYSSEVLTMKNLGRASYNPEKGEAWGWYYQIEEPKVIKERVSGFSQRYPYDYYSLSFSLTFFTQGLEPSFYQTFQPTIFVPVMFGWKTETYSKPLNVTDSRTKLDTGVVVARDTSVAVLQLMIPTMAIYFLMGCSLFTGSSDRLRDRISICLTTGVLTLSLYTFLLKQIEWIPLFAQNLAVSLVVSNVILLAFSIIASSERACSQRNWDLYAMTLASITPIIYLILSAFNLMSHLFQIIVADPLWIVQHLLLSYVDYRFLLWFVIFQLFFWSVYLYKEGFIGYITLFIGIGMLFFNSLKGGVFRETAFSIIGAIMVIASLFWLLKHSRQIPEEQRPEYCR